MATADELDALIAEARAAKHALATGTLLVRLRVGDRDSTFAQPDTAKLDRHIADLERQKAALSGTRRRRTFRVYQSGTGYY